VSSQMNAPNFIWMPEADHFFHGQLNELREAVKNAWATF
jgi:alpha/beta superfamily hydrolase